MTSRPGKEIVAVQVLSNISRSKGNQAMKLLDNTQNMVEKIKTEDISGSIV